MCEGCGRDNFEFENFCLKHSRLCLCFRIWGEHTVKLKNCCIMKDAYVIQVECSIIKIEKEMQNFII